jgi:hypothetical protein
MRLGGGGERHHDNGFPQPVEDVIGEDDAGPGLFDLGALAGVECHPPGVATVHGTSAISSWNDCQSSISRSSSLS